MCSFCAENREVPRPLKNARELDDPDKQFPALPPQFAEGQNEANPGSPSDDDFSAYKAARALVHLRLRAAAAQPAGLGGQAHALAHAVPR